jgi:hypothetical protein
VKIAFSKWTGGNRRRFSAEDSSRFTVCSPAFVAPRWPFWNSLNIEADVTGRRAIRNLHADQQPSASSWVSQAAPAPFAGGAYGSAACPI